MSLYSKTAQIDGLDAGLVMRGTKNGQYIIVIERDSATLEQIESVNWAAPAIKGDCILPEGYGFEVEQITYSSNDRSYRVVVRVARQFLGDVTEYQEQIADLRAQKSALVQESAEKQTQIDELEGQLAEADEALIAVYEAGMTAGETAGSESGEEEQV